MIPLKPDLPYYPMGKAAEQGPMAPVDFRTSENTVPPVEEAKTPAAKPFPAQGEPVRQEGEYHIFRGFGGVPFRSKSSTAPDIKAKDPRQPVVTADARVRVFNLADPGDLKDYTEVWDQAAKGFCVNPVEERQWVPEEKTWRVFMRWGVKYWELPHE